MVESFIITLREGIEAALVVGIILTYLAKTGRAALRRWVYLGLGLAGTASLGVAGFFYTLALDPENEYLEGALLSIGGLFVASVVVWMWSTARQLRGDIERRLEVVAGSPSWSGSALALLLFTFFMVFREGMETVLFLMAATLGEFNLLNLSGGVLGLAMALLFAVFFVQGSLRIDLRRFFSFTSLVLLLLALKLIGGGAHEFAEVGLIPMSKEVMFLLGYLVRGNSSTAILMALLVLPLLMVLWDTGRAAPRAASGEPSSVEQRKRRAALRRERAWRLGLLGVGLLVLLAMAPVVLGGSGYVDPEPVAVAAEDDQVSLELASLSEGQLLKFVYRHGDVPIRFLVVAQADGALDTALDACEICGTVGYGYDNEGNAICKNCNAPIPMNTIGLGGGCNPLPFEAQLVRGKLTIAEGEFVKAHAVFQ